MSALGPRLWMLLVARSDTFTERETMTNSIARTLHDAGLAAWFGGTLANAVALNPAAAQAEGQNATGAVANTGWDRWTPINAAAIGAHLVGSVILLGSDSKRL